MTQASLLIPTTCRKCRRPMHILDTRRGTTDQIIAAARRICEHCDCNQTLPSPVGELPMGEGQGVRA